MQRVWAILATAALVAVSGCDKSYKTRLDKTLEDMRYRKRLDDNLMPPPSKGKFEELLIYIRPPKNLQPAKVFLLPPPEPGKFDLEASFLDSGKPADAQAPTEGQPAGDQAKPAEAQKQSLHVLARVKRPKNPNAKKKVEPPANRGEFNRDVLALLNADYTPATELTPDKFKETTKKHNTFKHHSFDAGGKIVQVYLYGPKTSAYEVALVFEYPSSEHSSLTSKIELCLESFAEGLKAKRAYSGAVGDEPAGEGGTVAPAPGVF